MATRRNVVRKNIELNAEPVEMFARYFPTASLGDTLSMLLEKFMALQVHTPEEYAQVAAEQLKDEVAS
jgi:hypothetical protein